MIMVLAANLILCAVSAIAAPSLAIVATGNVWFAVFYLPWLALLAWHFAPEGPWS